MSENVVQELPRFQVLLGVEVEGSIITVNTQLPDRGAGYQMDDLRKWFKQDLHQWLLEHRSEVPGRTVRFNGPNTAPAFVYGGVAMTKAGADRIEGSTMVPGEWLTIAAHDDPEAPLPIIYEPGQIVKARVFGSEISELVIRGVSLGGQYQLCGLENREQVWISEGDVLEFIRRLPRREEQRYAEIPRYHRPFNDLGVRNGSKVRFILFSHEARGRVSAIRSASCNVVALDDSGQVAVLVPLDNVKEVL